jgi:hypothetical protein
MLLYFFDSTQARETLQDVRSNSIISFLAIQFLPAILMTQVKQVVLKMA